jgi:hypothetical protein
MVQIWTFNLVYCYAIRGLVFLLTYVFSFCGLSYIVYIVYIVYVVSDASQE